MTKELTTRVTNMCISKRWFGNISFRQAKRAMKRSCKEQAKIMKDRRFETLIKRSLNMPCGGKKKRK